MNEREPEYFPEEIVDETPETSPLYNTNLHYSDRGGHFQSSQYWKLQRKLERQGLPFIRHVPEFSPPPIAPQAQEMQANQEYIIRRKMMRNPRNGKK